MLIECVLAVAIQATLNQPTPSQAPPSQATTSQPAPRPPLWPGARYDSRIPTPAQVIGHDFGDEITPPDQVVAYLRALAQAAPDRTALIEYATSWEGRPLVVLAVGAPSRMARLPQLKADLQRLADPRGLTPAEADRFVAELPAVVWLMHAVHGNEISSSDAALAEAYHLLAAQGDPVVDAILQQTVVLIDPLQNPDGRARFIAQNQAARGAAPDPDPVAAEHDEPWPGGRENHYLFDMNRDWFAQSQPETRGRTRFHLQWYPHVVVDLHEMGGDSTYYFAPPADPLNPYITKAQIGWLDAFGRANAARFDERGFAYFNREVFDSFYPGYGESWPIFHGAIGMTYEQASSRGLAWRRNDDSLLTYRDAIAHHFTAAIATAHTAAVNRERILRDYLDYRRSAIADGERGPVREYLVPPGADRARSERFVRLLAAQGFEIRRALEPVALGARTLPAGTYVLPTAQPAGRLLRNLLDADVPQPEGFVKEQDRRRQRRMPEQFYDMTGWSLPAAFDVEVLPSDRVITARTAALVETKPESVTTPPAKVAYLAPWGSGTAAFVAEAVAGGLRVRSSDRPFTLGGRQYAGGTVIVRVSENDRERLSGLGALAARHDVDLVAADSSFTDAGISLGSNEVVLVREPRVAIAWDDPTWPTSAGWARYVLERRFGQRVTTVRARTLAQADLRRYDVIVLPSGTYGDVFSGDALKRLKDWLAAGGTLVTLAEASRWAARDTVGLLDTRTELRDGTPETTPAEKDGEGKAEKKSPEAPAPDASKPFDLRRAIQPERERPDATPGALLRVDLDTEHWLASGTDGQVQAVVEGRRIFTPIRLDKGRNVGLYATRDRLVVGGLVWDDAQRQLAQRAFLVQQPVGRGQVIAFAEDPNYRAFLEGTELLFVNAVLLGPAHAVRQDEY